MRIRPLLAALILVPSLALAQLPLSGPSLRLYDADSSNYVELVPPSTVTSNRTCALQDDATPFDLCVTAPTPQPTATPQPPPPTATPQPPPPTATPQPTPTPYLAYDRILDEETPLPQRRDLNFEGAGVTCADDTSQTTCTIGGGGGGGGGYETIEDEGTPLAQETTLNFTGAGITCTAETGKTECDVPGGGGSITSAAARVYNSSAQTIGTASTTVLTFNSERFDTNTLHDTSTNTSRLTAPVTGLYTISGMVTFATNGTGRRQLRITLNGTTDLAIAQFPGDATLPVRMNVQTIYHLSATDYVELRVYQDSGGNLDTVVGAAASPEFAMALLAGQ